MAFQHAKDALDWCMQAQIALVQADWSEVLLQHPGAAEEWADTDDRYPQPSLYLCAGG
jgi:hypothetical protein